jgi:DNA-binding response OmpR family regulator
MDLSPSPERRALVVDDEQPLARLVAGYLEREGFVVDLAFDGPTAVARARERDPEVIVLDLGLPGLDGIEVCRQVRTFSEAYVLMLTARAEEIDTLIGLSVGADDYVTKPFRPRELVARVTALLRRPRRTIARPAPAPEASAIVVGDLRIDPVGRDVFVADQPVALTRTEFDLLAALAGSPQRAFTRRALIAAVWGDEWIGDEHLVDVHLLHVRQKLGDTTTEQRYIRTVRGVGYRMGTGS